MTQMKTVFLCLSKRGALLSAGVTNFDAFAGAEMWFHEHHREELVELDALGQIGWCFRWRWMRRHFGCRMVRATAQDFQELRQFR